MDSQVVLITGAARRIGAGIARTLHAAGMKVIIHYKSSETEALQLCEELNASKSKSAAVLKADLSNFSELDVVIKQAVNIWGRLDVLVNNASSFYKTELGSITEFQWNDLLDINLKAPFFLAQSAAPFLKKQRGCIVNIADIHAERPVKEYPVYCISKAGLVMLTKTLAKELGHDIRVNAVSPGAILWPEGENDLSETLKQKILHRVTLGRHGEPTDIAKAVLYFIRDADYVTGQVLAVDGGRCLVS